MTKLTDLIEVIKQEAEEINELEKQKTLTDFPSILEIAIHTTLKEIRDGVNSELFVDFVIINFIREAFLSGYEPNDIKAFIIELSKDDFEIDSLEN